MMDESTLDEKLGPRLHWQGCKAPARPTLHGQYVSVVPMDADVHLDTLWSAVSGPQADPDLWLYLGNGPFENRNDFHAYLQEEEASHDPQFLTVIPHGEDPAGQISYMRMDPANGAIEIGHIWFGASMQRTPAATEAIYLVAKHVFDDLGYRRLEWKTTSRNERSRQAALRFGFRFEGIFRNHVVIRDRNRDTAWYAMTDEDWPVVKRAFETWLDPANFDADGHQIQSLASLQQMP